VFFTKLFGMDRIITASEANQRFSEMLRDVAEGESFTVTSRGRPVARVLPVDRTDQSEKIGRLLDFVREQPVRYSGPWTRNDLYE
jgi:prevent-host-death family protein